MAKVQLDLSQELEEQIQALFITAAREVLAEVSTQEINSKEFFTFKEAAAFLGISFNTLKKFITEYGLQTIAIGGKKFIHKPTLIQFLKKYEKWTKFSGQGNLVATNMKLIVNPTMLSFLAKGS